MERTVILHADGKQRGGDERNGKDAGGGDHCVAALAIEAATSPAILNCATRSLMR